MSNITAGGWQAIGVLLALGGILLLFKYGMPGRIGEEPRAAAATGRAAEAEAHYRQMGLAGTVMVVLGFLIQAMVALLSA
ncbi:hypothetical protein [Alsobacter sp. R-9]